MPPMICSENSTARNFVPGFCSLSMCDALPYILILGMFSPRARAASISKLMKRTIQGMAEAGEPLILEALEALRLYREAKASGSALEEVERLRVLAESLVQAVTDFQLLADGVNLITRH